jgi:3D-(3,5/4)-trihydroxycyclohexane-1,2-dione acylhydrolase (decyclizing)
MAEPTVRLTAGQAIIKFLQRQHSERDGRRQRVIPAICGIFGHGNVVGLAQGITEEGQELPLYQPKNEQSMVHAAIGYAKASRRLSTLACTSSIGPGATNMLTGAATATINRLPVLLFPGDTFANRRQGPVLQQLEHGIEADLTVNDAFRPLSRFFDRIARPEQLLTALPQAMRVLLDPAETGAATIALHQDVQGEAYDFPLAFFDERTWHVPRVRPDVDQLARAVELLRSCERPLVIAGGGVRYSGAEAELRQFAERFGIPVAETSAGKGSLTTSEWSVGGLGVNGTRAANALAHDADLVLCVGTRLTDFTTGSHSLFQDPGVRFVGVNTSAADAFKLSAEAVVGDAQVVLRELTAGDDGIRVESHEYRRQVQDRVAAWRSELEEDIAPRDGEPMGQGEVLKILEGEVTAGDWVVAGAGWPPGDVLKAWETPAGSRVHIEFGTSCMGHEIPSALGIRMQQGEDGEIFVLIGDGTYLMNPSELVTAVQESLKITVIVLVNGGYQSISRLAKAQAGGSIGNEFRARGTDGLLPDGDLVAVDYAAIARSMGLEAVEASTAEELTHALGEARAARGPRLIACPIAPHRSLLGSGAFWDLGVPEVSADEAVRDASAAHRQDASMQRHY